MRVEWCCRLTAGEECVTQAVPYIEAHLHLFRADSLSDAAAWASTN